MKRNWIIVAAVTGMLAASPALRAQDNTSGSTSTSTTTTPSGSTTSTTDTTTMGTGMTTGTGMNGSMSGGMMMGTVDYTMLNSKAFDYVDLKSAMARGLKEDEVATVAKISEKTGMPFRDIADAVLRGETFAKLADMYNLKLMDVMDVNDEKTKIANYMTTYESTGWKNVGTMGMMDNGMSGSSGSMGTGPSGSMGTSTDMGTGTTGTTNSTSTTTTTTGQ